MGGRGGSSGRMFSIPQQNANNFSNYSVMEILPKTLGEAIGSRGNVKSVNDAVKNSNPYYSDDYSDYSENCQRVVVAYELRRRGYDVIAQATYAGDKWQLHSHWRGAFRHAKTDNVGVSGNNTSAETKTLDNITAAMRQYGNGSRAVVSVKYRGVMFGHVFNVEYSGSKIQFVDAQSGEHYTKADMKNYLKIIDTSSVGLTRVDHLKISDRAKNFVWQRKRDNKGGKAHD